MARMRRKAELPTKSCLACGRPFAWRKKWERIWEEVRYCSDRCRAASKARLASQPVVMAGLDPAIPIRKA